MTLHREDTDEFTVRKSVSIAMAFQTLIILKAEHEDDWPTRNFIATLITASAKRTTGYHHATNTPDVFAYRPVRA
jgi:hypothetical protein